MTVTIPLEKMTTEEKLQALEDIQNDLQRDEESVPLPQWHTDELKKHESQIREGKSTFSDWDEAKQRIRDRKKRRY